MTNLYLTGIECMEKDCNILVPEDFICSALSKPDFRDRYSTRSFTDHIEVSKNYTNNSNMTSYHRQHQYNRNIYIHVSLAQTQ